VTKIALLTLVLLFLALSMLHRGWRIRQALQTGVWSMPRSQVRLAENPKLYWRVTIVNGVTLAVSLCAAIFVVRAM
jgi:hypothetical protein